MKAGIYARVSDDKFTEEGQRRQDIQRQIDRLLPVAQSWVEAQNALALRDGTRELWDTEIAIYKDDAITAFKEDYNSRPDFVRLLGEVDANRLHKVFTESLDRWSRRVVDGLTTMKRVSVEHNCTVTSIQDGEVEVTTPQGWFKTTIGFVMAEWASRDKSDKVKHALKTRRADKRRICVSCGIVHMGRHSSVCLCGKCLKKHPDRKGRVRSMAATATIQGAPVKVSPNKGV